MDLGVYLSKRTEIFALDIESKNAVGPTGCLIEVGRVDLPNVIPHHMVIQSLLLVQHRMHSDILHLKVTLLILHEHDLS